MTLAKKLEEIIDDAGFNEAIVKALVTKIIVSKDKSIELILNCQDVFYDELVSGYLEDTY